MMSDHSAMRGTVIQRMSLQDLEDVVSLETSSSPAPWSRASFLEEMAKPHAHCFVLKQHHPSGWHLIGLICFRSLGEESELLELSVHPEFRHLGFGRKLMEFYLQASKDLSAKQSCLEVGVTNEPALRLYQSLSYRPVGRRKRFYQGKFDALLLRREI